MKKMKKPNIVPNVLTDNLTRSALIRSMVIVSKGKPTNVLRTQIFETASTLMHNLVCTECNLLADSVVSVFFLSFLSCQSNLGHSSDEFL